MPKTITSVLDEAEKLHKKKGVDQQLIRRAKERFTELTEHATQLKKNNSTLHKEIKDKIDKMSQTSHRRTEESKGYDDLHKFLVYQNISDNAIWKNYALLLEYEKQASAAKADSSRGNSGRQRKPSSNTGKASTASPKQSQSRNSSFPPPNMASAVSPKQSQPRNSSFPPPNMGSTISPKQSQPRNSSFSSPNMRQGPVQGTALYKEPRQHVRNETVENGEIQQQTPPFSNELEHNKLMEENAKLKETVREQKQQIEDLTTRLSRYASQQLTQGNPNIADLSDKNRPTKIGEKFSLVYDDQWSEAFEALKAEGKTDEMVVTELATLVKECYKFSEEAKDKMRNDLVRRTVEVIWNPLQEHSLMSNAEVRKDVHLKGSNAIFNDLLKKYGEQSAKSLQMAFRKQNEKHAHDRRLTDYLDIVIELTWSMVIQDPPMTLKFVENGEKMDEKSFKPYSKKGNIALICVWPALYLYNGGPIVSKGYALPQ